MAVKILAVMGNPRKNGYTQRLAGFFLNGLRCGAAEVQVLDLCRLRINHCLGCYSCWLVHPGVCVHQDDMAGAMERFRGADIVVFLSPLNAFGTSSQTKVFLDRMFSSTKEGFVPTPAGLTRNTVRDPERWPKKLAYVLVGAFRGEENFAAAQRTFELFSQAIDTVLCGGLIRPESYLLQFELAKPKTIKIVETAFEQAGIELATRGEITAETASRAATPLSSDLQHFQRYANIYWEHARSLGSRALDVSAVREKVLGDMRVLLSEMVRSVDVAATARKRFTLQFDFTDTGAHFRVSVDHGVATLKEEPSEQCDLRVTTRSATWANVFMRKINVRDALASGEIKLAGDKMLFTRLDRYFPPPSV
jgi:putative sterol carrier protein/putative NADPH-quinone reductase